ncbi:AAA ATPase domain-containing protein (fragment) [Pseudodesulfovibrio profundus]|uniref:AAA ATPase domain-containing protein n=2 Tax=Pseudodesulfovibrio profundus TaxID=57320 RepID=A0A2C8F5A8_9BACT
MDYYSNNSDNSKMIKAALESSTYEDLMSFAQVYEYQGMALRSVLMHKNAFNPLSDSVLENVKQDFLDVLEDVFKLSLFKFIGFSGGFDDLRRFSPAQLAGVEYAFIGDALDRLYVLYVFEKITGNSLVENDGLKFEDLLARKFGHLLYDELLPQKVEIDLKSVDGVFSSLHKITPDQPELDLHKDVKELSRIDPDKKISEDNKKKIIDISNRYNLEFAAHAAYALGYTGYYSVVADISVKGKRRYVSIMCPVKGEHDGTCVAELVNDFTDHITNQFDKYLVEVLYVKIDWIPITSLVPILIVFRDDDYEAVEQFAKAREFDRCAVLLQKILMMTMRRRGGKTYHDIDDYNNYGFCVMNAGGLEKAEVVFKDCNDAHIVSKINYAYLQMCKMNYMKSKKMYKSLIKQLTPDYECRFLNLAIVHDEIESAQTVIEDVIARNVVCWNAALMSSYLQESRPLHGKSHTFTL